MAPYSVGVPPPQALQYARGDAADARRSGCLRRETDVVGEHAAEVRHDARRAANVLRRRRRRRLASSCCR
jgi:hypothetical protein